jgi:hypothetical protein
MLVPSGPAVEKRLPAGAAEFINKARGEATAERSPRDVSDPRAVNCHPRMHRWR